MKEANKPANFFDQFNSLVSFVFSIFKLMMLGVFLLFAYWCSVAITETDKESKKVNESHLTSW